MAGEGERNRQEYIDYVEAQLWDLIRFLEKHTGKKFNESKFLKTIDRSYELSRLFMDVYDYRKRFPANRYFEWVRLYMLPLVCQWNEKDAVRFYRNTQMAQKRYGENKVIESGQGEIPGGLGRDHTSGTRSISTGRCSPKGVPNSSPSHIPNLSRFARSPRPPP